MTDEPLAPEFNSSMMYLYRLAQIQQSCIDRLISPDDLGHPYNTLMAFYVELYPRMKTEMQEISKKLIEQEKNMWVIYRTLNGYAHELGLIMKDQDDAKLAFKRGRK